MNKRLYMTIIMSLILMVAIIGSGCADSQDADVDDEYVESTEVDSVPEEPEVDDSTFTNSIGMQFVKISEGSFLMGAQEEELYSDKDERPVREVTIGDDFYIGIYEVTQEQWEKVMESEPSYFEGADLPVEKVSWVDANKFIDKLNKMEDTDAYRLPTEAEWEYAAKAGTSTAFSFGDDESMLEAYGWYDDNSEDKTRPVGMKEANPWGLYDVHGNVAEWVADEYHSNYQKAPTDGSEWTGGVDRRVIRGGSWENAESNCRSSDRDSIGDGSHKNYIGFRLVKEL